jgi:alkylhydroperoxidase family enzyme
MNGTGVPRIQPVDLDELDADSRRRIEQAQIRGVPLPEVERIMAHAPAVLQAFDHYWSGVVAAGSVDPELKELLRMHVAKSLGATEVLGPSAEDPRLALLDAYSDDLGFSGRERAALHYADAIVWGPSGSSDEMWDALHKHFSEPEIVELSVVIALFSGGHRWISTLGIGEHPATT